MHIVLNELSISKEHCQFSDPPQTKISEFVSLLHVFLSSNRTASIVTLPDVFSFMISDAYGIKDWLKDPSVKHEHKQFFRTAYSNRCTYINAEDYGGSEFIVNINGTNISCAGCLVAHETCSNTISASTNRVWLERQIPGSYEYLDENEGYHSALISIMNISSETHLEDYQRDTRTGALEQIFSGQDLWEKRKELFPHLQFCESVKDQLYNDPQKFHIEQVIAKLSRLEEYFADFDGRYNPHLLGLRARTESDTVKQNPELRNMRRFIKPDGAAEFFFDHVSFTGNYRGRIHFLPDTQSRTGIIGYIGRHLKTDQY